MSLEIGDELWVDLVAGDQDAWRDFCDSYRSMLVRTAQRRLRVGLDPEDAVQDALMAFIPQVQEEKINTHPMAFLMRILHNLVTRLNQQHDQQRVHSLDSASTENGEITHFDPEDTLSESPDARLLDDEMWEALGKLDDRQRQVIVLHYLEGRTYKEVGEALGLSKSQVRTLLARARQSLIFVLLEAGFLESGESEPPKHFIGKHPDDGEPIELVRQSGKKQDYLLHNGTKCIVKCEESRGKLTLDRAVQLLRKSHVSDESSLNS